MKKLFIPLVIFCSSLSFADEPTNDYVILQNGNYVHGQVIDIGKSNIKINDGFGVKTIKNNDILVVAFNQEITSEEKFRLGYLDGKRHAKNQIGNLLLGVPSVFLAGIPLLFVYAISNQKPNDLGITEENKLIIDDLDYLKGYKRGAKHKSFLKAVQGGVYGIVIIVTVLFTGPSFP